MRALSPVPGWDREVAAHLPANRIREESPPHRQMSSGKQHFSDKMWQLSNLDRSRHLMEAVRCVTTDNKVCVCLVRAMSVAMLYTDVCRRVLLAPFVLWLYGRHFLCLSPQWCKKKTINDLKIKQYCKCCKVSHIFLYTGDFDDVE